MQQFWHLGQKPLTKGYFLKQPSKKKRKKTKKCYNVICRHLFSNFGDIDPLQGFVGVACAVVASHLGGPLATAGGVKHLKENISVVYIGHFAHIPSFDFNQVVLRQTLIEKLSKKLQKIRIRDF